MRKVYLMSGLLVFFVFPGLCQDEGYSKKYLRLKEKNKFFDGYVVENDGDTLRGIIKLRQGASFQISSFWFVSEFGKRIYYEPLEVIGFKMGENSYLSNEGSFFLILYQSSQIDLLQNVTLTYGTDWILSSFNTPLINLFHEFEATRPVSHLHLKERNEFLLLRNSNFKTKLMQEFMDCPTIEHSLESKNYKIEDLISLIDEYENCNE